MNRKYLSLEEAADRLGLSVEQLMRHREQGEIRGFADRGSWKFRDEDVDEFLRSRQADSSPDVPLADSGGASVLDDEATDLSASDSDVRLFFDDSMFEDSPPVRPAGSDVRLTGDSGPRLDGGSADDDLNLAGWDDDRSSKTSDSDSDVQLVGNKTDPEVNLAGAGDGRIAIGDSDSDVRLSDDQGGTADDSGITLFDELDSDSDVKLTGAEALLSDDSDSDVKLAPGLTRTDSDIRLTGDTPAGKKQKPGNLGLTPHDSDLKLIDSPSKVRRQASDDSGISLTGSESGISLEVDSGISLEADDSGISLESFDSGTDLGTDDSGISLDAADSGITLSSSPDSGISLESGDASRTMPMKSVPGGRKALRDAGGMTTEFDIPARKAGSDSEFELAGLGDDDDEGDVGTGTDVLKFSDEDFDKAGSKKKAAVAEDESYDDEEYEEGFDDEELSGEDEYEDEDEEAEFAAPAGTRASQRGEAAWGTGLNVMIGIGSVLSVVCSLTGIELVRTMWLWTQPGSPKSSILEIFGGLFG